MNDTLAKIQEDLRDCQRCKLASTRTSIVFGEGDPQADWMFVGEGPGADEDLQGRPFVGRSGEILNKWLTESGWDRDRVYIANIVKCRPPNNRDPETDEIVACRSFLSRQIWAVKPKVITTLGKAASNLLLDLKEPMFKLRGRTFVIADSFVVAPTYHPSYILRGNWPKEREVHEDLGRAITTLLNNGVAIPKPKAAWALEHLVSWCNLLASKGTQ